MTKMYQQQGVMISTAKVRTQTVGNVIPVIVPILLATLQLLLFLAIIALESASVYYDAGRGTIYAGFWCSICFFVTWIAMFSLACCKNSYGCGIYLVVQNIISAIFAIILIIFTALFIEKPCLCYGFICNIPNWESVPTWYVGYPYGKPNCTNRTLAKLPVLKSLLSCAVLMLFTNLIFIIIYIISYISLRNKTTSVIQVQPIQIPAYEQPFMIQPTDQYELPMLNSTISEPRYYSPAVETVGITNQPLDMHSMKF